MRRLSALLARAPLTLLHAVGWLLGWLAFLSSAGYRRRFTGNAAQAGYSFAAVRSAVGHAGKLVAELPRLWHGAPVAVVWHGAELIEAAHGAGRGILFLTPHLGAFEVSAQAYAQRFGTRHGPITVLYRAARKAWITGLVESSRARPGLDTVPTTLSGIRTMIRALRRGRAIGLLPDQVPPEGMGEWAPFFGRDAYTMTLAGRLAALPEVATLWARVERLPGGQGYALYVSEPHAAVRGAPLDAAGLNREIEHLVRQCPGQYLWGYARYKQPREDRTSGQIGRYSAPSNESLL